MSGFLRSAVKKALHSKTGHLDLFLRFLLGQSQESRVGLLKEKIRENNSLEKSINLFHCLNKLNDHSGSPDLPEQRKSLLSPWNQTLSFLLVSSGVCTVVLTQNSEVELDVFNLHKYYSSEECLLRLLPVVKSSRTVL